MSYKIEQIKKVLMMILKYSGNYFEYKTELENLSTEEKELLKSCKYILNKYKKKTKIAHEGIDTRITKPEEAEQSSDSVGDPSDNDNNETSKVEPNDELKNASVADNTSSVADNQIVDPTNGNTSVVDAPSKLDILPQPKKKGKTTANKCGNYKDRLK